MNSPDINLLTQLIVIDRADALPIYRQIVQAIINAIQRGYLKIGNKFPGTRQLADKLSVHRKTVIAAFEDLQAQGWIEIKPNKGTYVIQEDNKIFKRGTYNLHTSTSKYPSNTGYKFLKSNILDFENKDIDTKLVITDGLPDLRITDFKAVTSHYNAFLQRKNNIRKIQYNNFETHYSFREQLANYLNLTRGLHIGSNNIQTINSIESCLYIIAKVLIEPSDVVLVAKLTNQHINMCFLNAGAKIVTVDIDRDGVVTTSLRKILSKLTVRALYLMPHHHYPTTCILSRERRIEILELAHQYGFIIIEDDYDYDFNFEKSAIMPLASADTNGMAVYIGQFAKHLGNPFDLGYIVGPNELIQEISKYKNLLQNNTDRILEHTLAQFISDGEIQRQLKKSNKIYEKRRNFTAIKLLENFQSSVKFEIPESGLAYWLEFDKSLPLLKIADLCKKNNLHIPRNILYQNKNLTAIRFGFGNLDEQEIEESLNILATQIKKV